MKKTVLLSAIAMIGISAQCLAQKATVLLNNYDANYAILYQFNWFAPREAAPLNRNVNVQILGGPSAQQLEPVTIAGTTTSLIPISLIPGFFDAGVGVVPGVTAGSTATFKLLVFLGSYHPPGANTFTWTQTTGSWDDTAIPPQPPTGPPLQIPPGVIVVVDTVPEASTVALGLVGLGALFLYRRFAL